MNTSAETMSQRPSLGQGQKTAIFGAVACLAVLIALEPWRVRPTSESETQGVVQLFPGFTKAAQATGIQITKFDEDTGKPYTFSVKLQDGRWVIPSHEDYPADARQHMAEAAVSVLDLKTLGMVSDRPGEFQTYGVVAPDPSKLRPGDTGVGMEVTFRGANDSILADLIIGKSASKDQADLRFVRQADHNQVYQVTLKTDKLSTNFADWIEKDLLKINAFDIREVQLNDYSLEEGVGQDGQPALAMIRRSKMKLDYDDEKSKWQLADMVEYKKRAELPAKLGEDEELNAEKLNAMRNALDDLKIVDVQRKPAGLSRDLRVTDAFVKNREAAMSLQERGFYAFPLEDGQTQILSTEGEVLAFVKDGVEYMLRFGGQTVARGDQKEESKKSEAGEDKSKSSRLNRYLFISCRFVEDRIPKPQLRELPSEPDHSKQPSDEAKTDAGAPAGAAAPENKPAEPAPGDAQKSDAAPPAGGAEGPAGKQGATARPRGVFRLVADEKPPAAGTPEAPAANKAGEAPAAPASPAGTPAAAPEEEGGKTIAKAREAKALADERAAIEKENKRLQTEYDEKIKKGHERVQELNDRFADWYYVISDEVYHKIHLSRADVIKKKDATPAKSEGVGGPDALKNLLPGVGHKHDGHDHDDHKHDGPK